VVGDSAGGHLALVAALALARTGRRLAGLALFAPNTDRSGLSETRGIMTPHDPMNADADDARLAAMCFGDRAPDDPELSPALDDLASLPPTHVEVGDREVLLGDALALHLRAADAGARCRLHVRAGLVHMGQLWAPWWPPGVTSLDRAAGFLRPLLGGVS
jgi:acetyl esterase/lipase